MAIEVRNLTKSFNGFTALQDVSLSVPDGSLTALLGPSGGGKSTLLRVIAGLERPDAGEVLFSGESVTGLPAQQRGVGFVFQHYAAFNVSRLGNTWVRPHDIEVLEDHRDGAIEAIVERVAKVGFEVRIEAALGDGTAVPILTTRLEAEELELRPGQIVWLRVHQAREFAT